VLGLMAIVVASGQAAAADDLMDLSPEHRRILGLCREPATVADVASDTALPPGVVRVLLADLVLQGRIKVLPPQPAGEQPRADLLREVLHGLRAL
jgi:predicted Rossmann fold nucleotide-binding protein DprA/Smf involved in DNA uptake